MSKLRWCLDCHCSRPGRRVYEIHRDLPGGRIGITFGYVCKRCYARFDYASFFLS